MKKVFISYTTHDIQRASAVRKMLEENDISCWMGDKDIHASNTYTADITKAIDQCRVFVLILSSYSQESSYVLSEFECAISKHKPVVPFIIENFRIREEFNFHIRQRQAIPAFEDWKEGMQKLLETVKHRVQKNRLSETVPIHDDRKLDLHDNSESDPLNKIVKCPFCGCGVLKRRRLFVDRYLYPIEGSNEAEAVKMFLLKYRRKIAFVFAIISLLATIFTLILFGNSFDQEKTNVVTGIFTFISFALCVVYTYVMAQWSETNDVESELFDAIELSELKYWTFKCADCEKNFSILLPKADDLNVRVPGLIKRIPKEEKKSQ